MLRALTDAEVGEADLPEELVCTFSTNAGPLLVAAGYVAVDDPARGLIKVGSSVQPAIARGTGFDAMRTRGELTSKGLTLDLEAKGENLSLFEGSRHQADLVVWRADGAERVYAGEWNCGP